MITITKYSKLDEVDSNLFHVASVSGELKPTKENVIAILDKLIPNAEILTKVKSGDMKKDKFLEKYKKQLQRDNGQLDIFGIGLSIENSAKGLCIVCSDEEWKLGYIQVLKSKLEKVYGIKFETPEKLAKEIKSFEKKIPKKIKNDKKKYEKAIKEMLKSLKKKYITLSPEGEDNFIKLRRKFAVDHVLAGADRDGYITAENGEAVVNEKAIKDMKTSSFIKAFMASSKEYKLHAKIIAKVLKGHDMKLTEKALKKLTKVEILSLTCECGDALQRQRYGVEEQ